MIQADRPPRTARRRRAALLSGAVAIVLATPLSAQTIDPGPVPYAGGEVERYLRLLQVAGETPLAPWSLRPFGPLETDRLLAEGAHPWAGRIEADPGRTIGLLPVDAALHLNSAFPHGTNQGLVWAGRGVTTFARAGAYLRAGPVTAVLAPELFWTQNADFELAPNGQEGRLRFADPRFPRHIDRPQRFGESGYGRLEPGQSTVRIDLPWIAAGVSTANQVWGPADRYPVLMGTDAAGYPHLFLTTGRPLDLWVARVTARATWGMVDSSPYAVNEGREGRRFLPAIVVVISPRWLEGLELGLGRLYHVGWPEDGPGLDEFLRPYEAFLKRSRGEIGGSDGFSTPDNQLAAAFARWVFPAAGFEVWAEYGRNDHNWDARDLVLQPDHDMVLGGGFRKVWTGEEAWWTFRGEAVNGQITHLAKVRNQVHFYRHSAMIEGHTHRGQLLGSPAVFGGVGTHLALDRYDGAGRWTLSWERVVRDDARVQANQFHHTQPARSDAMDVQHVLDLEAVRFVGPWQVLGGLGFVYNLERDLRGDAFNLNLRLGASFLP